jgi:pilus assembly protein Flp/PilA
MTDLLRRLWRNKQGATAVEYGLILALIFLAMVVAVQGVANENVRVWNKVDTNMPVT